MKCFNCGSSDNLHYEKGTQNIFCSQTCQIGWPLSTLPNKEVRWQILSNFNINELSQYYENIRFDADELAIFTPDFYRFYVRKNPKFLRDDYYFDYRFKNSINFQLCLYGFAFISNDLRVRFYDYILLYTNGYSKFISNWIQNDLIDPKYASNDIDALLYAFKDVIYSGEDAVKLFNNQKVFNAVKFSRYISTLYYEGPYEGKQKSLFLFLIDYGIEKKLKWSRKKQLELEQITDIEYKLINLERDFNIFISMSILSDIEVLKKTNNLKDFTKQIVFDVFNYDRINIDNALYYIEIRGQIGNITYDLKVFYNYIYKNINNYAGLQLRKIINLIKPIKFTDSVEVYKNIKVLSELGGSNMFVDVEQFIEHCKEKMLEYEKSRNNLYFDYAIALQFFESYNKKIKR